MLNLKISLITVLLIVISGLLICSFVYFVYLHIQQSSVTEGVVINMKFTPEHDETIMMPTMIGRHTILMPKTRHYDDEWLITFEGKDKKGEIRQRTVYVNKKIYDKYKKGDYIIFEKEN